jgi:hypothetical protein
VATDAVDLALPGAERAHDQVSGLAGEVEEAGVTRGAVQRDRGLDQMPDAVQLVTPLELLEPLAGESHLEVRVEIPVVLLDLGQQAVRDVEELLQLGCGRVGQLRVGQRPADRFQPLVDIAVQEGQVVHVLAGAQPGRQFEVVEVPRLVQMVPTFEHADLAVHPASLGPQARRDRPVRRGPESDPAVLGQTDRSRLR